jgi:GTP-binding protein HflX
MGKGISTKGLTETGILVGLILPNQGERLVNEYLEELAFLAETAGINTKKQFTQRLDHPDVRSFVKSGKLEEINDYVKEFKIDTVIFDDDLSPSQLRNLERELKVKIYDRSLLILDIFQSRARTAQAKTQVELARYQYLLPRLTRMWTHLERQRGGTGTRGGAGEKEIETDKRMIRNQITVLKKKLQAIDKQMATQRKNRGQMVRVALVGYTNVGKSTIMNTLSKSEVFAENKLFATLDTTVRKVVIENLPFLLSDTVGFIRKLPHQLVESFKSTLDEVREADVLVHVVDISHPNFEDHVNTVQETLNEIDGSDKPTIMVFNKIDQYNNLADGEFDYTGGNERQPLSLDELKRTWIAKTDGPCVFISAKDRQNLDGLREIFYREIKEMHAAKYPYNNFLY